MAEKRKISVRKILQMVLTIVVTTCCVIAMVSASKIEGEKTLTSVAVHIQNGKRYHFIEQKEIMDLAINNRHIDIMHTPLSRLDIRGIEQVIKSDPWVAEAQAFIDMNRVLHMYVTQRIPVARIFEWDSKSYYMDATLHTMPLSTSNIYYTTVVTNVPDSSADSTAIRKQIYALTKVIQEDTFWNAQISQVIMDSAGMFEIAPVIGNQRIIFGDTSHAKEKLDNLFAFYKNVLNRIGWDKYETLDLRFNDQVVASPSLPYKGVSDKAIDKMNWINSIILTEAQNDMRDSLKAVDVKNLQTGFAHAAHKPEAAPAAKDKASTTAVVKTAAVVAGGTAAAILAAKQLKKPTAVIGKPNMPAGKTSNKQNGKTIMPGKQGPAAVKPPSAPFGKGTVVAKPVTKEKDSSKSKAGTKKVDKKKAADKTNKKKAAEKKKTDNKQKTKNTKSKPAQKSSAKVVNSKKNNKTDKKKAVPKYAYPEHKGH